MKETGRKLTFSLQKLMNNKDTNIIRLSERESQKFEN
jgi:hypothetical protein